MDKLIKIRIEDIDSFKNHPFLVNHDESLKELAKSIKENGLLNPLIVRKKENGRYEMISGHRRKEALELNGIKEVEVYVKELNDDEATIYMVDSNIYREKILPSEKAFAYKMKMDAMKHQGKKNETSTTKLSKKRTDEIIGEQNGESREQVRKYIRLTYLIPELLELVDNTVKYDKRTFLTMVLLNYNTLEEILLQKKGNQNEQISFNKEKIESVLPYELLKRDKRYIEQYIIEAIKNYNALNKQEVQNIDIDNLKV